MPFPSMPVGFWNDPDGRKYRAAYFERFPGVWQHGDYIELTEHDGVIIYGRSDAVLNPGGVRIGTAEIYRQVEQLDEIVESLVIGQQWDNDERIVLFVRLRDGLTLTPELRSAFAPGAREHHAAARPGPNRAGHRDSADEERKDRGAGGSRHRARPRDQESGSAREPGSAGTVPRSTGTALTGLTHLNGCSERASWTKPSF